MKPSFHLQCLLLPLIESLCVTGINIFLKNPQTMVTPMTQRFFSFGELANSLMYSLCGVEVILGFFFVRWLSRKVVDRAVLAVGLVICSAACIWCLVFLCNPGGANLSRKKTQAHTCKGTGSVKSASRSVPKPFCATGVVRRGAILGYTLAALNVLCK